MKTNLIRTLQGFSVGGSLIAAFVAMSPTPAAASVELVADELKCAETETRLVCCVVDGTTVKSCVVLPK
jgi:hypothetical protein